MLETWNLAMQVCSPWYAGSKNQKEIEKSAYFACLFCIHANVSKKIQYFLLATNYP